MGAYAYLPTLGWGLLYEVEEDTPSRPPMNWADF